MTSKKTIFSKSWRSLSIHSDGFLAARTFRTNERQETCRTNELRIIHRTNEETPRTNEFQSIHRTNEETRRTKEFQRFTERKRKLAEPTRLRILTERTKQRLWLLLIENSRNDVFQPLSRTSKNGSNQKYS